MVNHRTSPMPADLPEHLKTWADYQERSTYERAIARGADAEVFRPALDTLRAVSALDALRANREAVELLVGRRWYVMQEAREAGKTWDAIGDALGITKQGAQDYYRRQIAKQETYAAEIHERDRARAALDTD